MKGLGETIVEHRDKGECHCRGCAGRIPFEMPDQLAEAYVRGDLIVFAGAGASTESEDVLPSTLYTHIHELLGMKPDERETFPALMERYEQARGRSALLGQIKQRLDYVHSFPELDVVASKFHRELATAFRITEIITTNWDDYFERECGATPYVTEKDWAFWRESRRKVFKLHGSLASPGSIVATSRDYRRCYREMNRGLIGATLKTMLATKTVVFVGYSFGDADFNAVYSLLRRRMQEILPRAFVVTLDEQPPPKTMTAMHAIRTDATYFIECLKAVMPDRERIPDERLDAARHMAQLMWSVHSQMLEQLPLADHPDVAICALYQDGLIHAFEHQAANRRTGMYSHRCDVARMVDTYEQLRAERLRHRHYGEVAYIDGYLAGLNFLLGDEKQRPPSAFYLFGHKAPLMRPEQFLAACNGAARLHKSAHHEAQRIAAAHAPYGTIPHHKPMLLPADGRIELVEPPLPA